MVQQKAFDYLDAPIKRITTKDTSAPYAPNLFQEWFPQAKEVVEAVKAVMYKS
jgi:pyruvate dehydrogenase E1 component beta subunit